ncbi:RNA-directed DNA polymerase, eukaryota [Tanacetum coccineum]
MESMEVSFVKQCWGNFSFEYVHSDSIGNSGGILCIWDPNSFCRSSSTVSDYFVIIRGTWLKNGKNLLVIVVYAPQDAKEKSILWEYLTYVSNKWAGDVVIMGDFNEVRLQADRFGSVFSQREANRFNDFINKAGLEEVPLGGSKYTWSHRSARKMSKLDRFLVSGSLMYGNPLMSAVTLERFLSDHRPILLRESTCDYGPTPFRFFHYWTELEGFDKLVNESWEVAPSVGSNPIRQLMVKLKFLKAKIRDWIREYNRANNGVVQNLKLKLADIDEKLDQGSGNDELISKRLELINKIKGEQNKKALEIGQKTKIRWHVEGDENSKFFHGMLNKTRSMNNIRGIMDNGKWTDEPSEVKKEFFQYFSERFCESVPNGVSIDKDFPKSLSKESQEDIERNITLEEIKKAVWECGTDKSPGPDGYSFGFYRRYWNIINNDVVKAVQWFFNHGEFPEGCNSHFIALIPKIPDANMVKDFWPISLIGSLYKIVTKIMTNRLVCVIGEIINEVQSAFIGDRQILDGPFIINEVMQWCKHKKKQAFIFKVDFEKAYNSVRWEYLDEVLHKFGFGVKWRGWIQGCLKHSKGSILINGSPTKEFTFSKGLKQGDPLSPFLFIIVMESLHIAFQRVVDAGLYSGLSLSSTVQLSHLFYADDAMFVGQWSDENIGMLVNVLKWFFRASGLRINMAKSKIMGIHVNDGKVGNAAAKLGCLIMRSPFVYLGTKVGGNMARVSEWKEVIDKVMKRLSKWKLKALSIGGRLTLIKSVLGSTPLFSMSSFKAPMTVLQNLEAIRSRFFHGHEMGSNQMSWVRWNRVLTAKDKGGLGVPSLYALNRGMLMKWIWRFIVQPDCLWSRVIKAIHGNEGGIGCRSKFKSQSNWLSIIEEAASLKEKGINFFEFVHHKLGNGESTKFWEDKWWDDKKVKDIYPRLYALENNKTVSVARKIRSHSLEDSFRRSPRGGTEAKQMEGLVDLVNSVELRPCEDRFVWNLDNSGEFSVSSIRKYIDNVRMPGSDVPTIWIKSIPNKVNILAWKIRCDALPSRLNLSRRGIPIDSILCPICGAKPETVNHIFLSCEVARQIFIKICRWWHVDYMEVTSFEEWKSWMDSIRISSRLKAMFTGVCFTFWWWIWNTRNKLLFDKHAPKKADIYDNVVSYSFNWCKSRCKANLNWDEWLKNPNLM